MFNENMQIALILCLEFAKRQFSRWNEEFLAFTSPLFILSSQLVKFDLKFNNLPSHMGPHITNSSLATGGKPVADLGERFSYKGTEVYTVSAVNILESPMGRLSLQHSLFQGFYSHSSI